jgi:hypothetical protein
LQVGGEWEQRSGHPACWAGSLHGLLFALRRHPCAQHVVVHATLICTRTHVPTMAAAPLMPPCPPPNAGPARSSLWNLEYSGAHPCRAAGRVSYSAAAALAADDAVGRPSPVTAHDHDHDHGDAASSRDASAGDESADSRGAGAASAVPYTFDILYQDEHFVAIDKPQGFFAHPPGERS